MASTAQGMVAAKSFGSDCEVKMSCLRIEGVWKWKL
jgi:hypothetical protein